MNVTPGSCMAEMPYGYQPRMRALCIATELVIAVLAIIGNFLVCLAVSRNKTLRTVTNYFLPQETPDFRTMCERLQAQVEQLLKRDKWLTDINHELGQKLSRLYLARTTFHNGHYELIQEEEEEPHSLAFKCQRRVHVANMTVEHLEEQMIQKEKEFEQAFQIKNRQHLLLQNKCAREAQRQKKGDDEVVKNLMEEVNDLRSASANKALVIIEIQNKLADAYKELDAHKRQYDIEKESFDNYRKHIDDYIKKLLMEMDHRVSAEVFLRKKKINELKDENTELSNQLRKGQALQADTLSELDRVKLQFNAQVIRLTVQEKRLISSHEIQAELKVNESKFTNIIHELQDSKCQKIADLTNLVTELEEKNNDVNARRDNLHQKWKKALRKGSEQAVMIRELQDDIRLKAGKNNALVEEQVVVKEQHRDLSNQLINVKWQLAESRKALDVCLTSAVNERALGEKKMAAEKEKLEELEEELQRHKELLEEGNEQMKKLQVENEQLRRKHNLMKFVVLPRKTPQKLKDTCFPFLKKSTIQPKETSQAHPASSNLLPLRKSKQTAPSPTQISSQTPSKVDQKIEESVGWELHKYLRAFGFHVTSNEQPLGKKKMAEVEPLQFSPVPPTCRAQPAFSNLLPLRKRKLSALSRQFPPHPNLQRRGSKNKMHPTPFHPEK